MRRQPRSRFLRSVLQTAADTRLSMPWTRARPAPAPKPTKIIQFRRA